MKKLLAIAACSMLAYGAAFAQGNVTFANSTTTRVTTNSAVGVAGNAAANVRVQLYWANAAGAPEAALVSVTNAPISISAAGLFSGSTRTLDTMQSGGMVTLQVRGWTANLGADYETAFAAWLAQPADVSRQLGRSSVFTLTAAATTGSPPPTPTPIVGNGFTGLALAAVPEPSTYALGALGLGLLALFRRRK